MMFLLILTMQIRDSIEPSFRIKALGEDLAFMIEDYQTDIQRFPSHLAFDEGKKLYIRSLGGSSWTGLPPFKIGWFSCPMIRNLGFGVDGSYIQEQFSDSTQTIALLSVTKGISSSFENRPAGNLYWCFPFIKDGGVLGLKLSILRPYSKNSGMNSDYYADTNTTGSDTTISNRTSLDNYCWTINNLPWNITLSQYLPLGGSALDLTLNFGTGSEQDTGGSGYNYYTYNEDINHNGSVRIDYITTSENRHSLSLLENTDLITGGAGFVWTNFPAIADVKIFGHFSFQRSRKSGQAYEDYFSYYIYRTEYADSDTSYVIVDTFYYDALSYDSLYGTRSFEDGEMIGVALARTAQDNFYIYAGILGNRYCRNATNEWPDTTRVIHTNLRVILPVAGEFFVTPSFCLRAGIKAMYENSSTETKDGDYKKTNNDIFRFSRTCGIGFNLDKRLNVDLYVDSDNLTSWRTWGLEAMYRF